MKKNVGIILLLSFLFGFSIASFAHSTSQSSYLDSYTDKYGRDCVGSAESKWAIKEFQHWGSYTGTYRFDSSVPSEYQTMFERAVTMWEDATYASLTETTSTSANITVTVGAVSGNAAATAAAYSDSYIGNGHYTRWIITINEDASSLDVKSYVLAHELGHVFGLTDLDEPECVDALMYHTRGTARTVTVYEARGFNVIMGLHSSHSWQYTDAKRTCSVCFGVKTASRNYTWMKYSPATHKGTCSLTGEVVYEAHSYYTNPSTGVCGRCGYQGNSIEINSNVQIDKN